jgi:hypothetical protein
MAALILEFSVLLSIAAAEKETDIWNRQRKQ